MREPKARIGSSSQRRHLQPPPENVKSALWRQVGAQVPRLLGEKEERLAKLSRFARQEVGCDTPRDRANSPLTVRWPWGPARRGAPTILPAVQPAVLLSSFGAGGPRAFVTLSRKLRICMSRKPGLAGACRYYLRLGAWARRRLSSDTTRTSSRFSPDLSAAASIPTGSRCGGRYEVRFAGK